jgi:hypothetical protein
MKGITLERARIHIIIYNSLKKIDIWYIDITNKNLKKKN